MELNDLEIGDIVISYYSKIQNGLKGQVYIYLRDDKFFHVARIADDDLWLEMGRNFTYVWDQLIYSGKNLIKGDIDKIQISKLRFAIMKIFEPRKEK